MVFVFLGVIFGTVAAYHASAFIRQFSVYFSALERLPSGPLVWGTIEQALMAISLSLFALFLSGMLFPPKKGKA